FGDQEGGVSLTDLRKISQLPLTKLKVILALLKKSGYIEPAGRGKYKLPPDLDKRRVLDLANYETKKSYDQSKLGMMLQYAETGSCRRRFILNYFGEDYERHNCGACDNCLRQRMRAGVPAAATVPAATGFHIGDVIAHAKFGQGTVERSEKD